MKINSFTIYLVEVIMVTAFDDLSKDKVASQSPTLIGLYYNASYAVDRDISTCMRSNEFGISAPDDSTWWKVDLGGIRNIYSIHILFLNYKNHETRQRGRFAGFSLYISDTDVSKTDDIQKTILCYKDGPLLPPLNFTTICKAYGRYVIFYNERKQVEGDYPNGYEVANVFTELCEVMVQGCNKPDVYGNTCNNPCPLNCKNNACDIQNGTCFSCIPGWNGTHCNTKCIEGLYGVNCSQQCSGHCRDGVTCNHVTGQCDGGCDAGWSRLTCEKDCDDGTYGYNCVNNCSGHCLNDSPCNKRTGQCGRGCNPGYINGDCSKGCPSGHYGMNCKESCSGNCKNNESCDHVSGVCLHGCQDGYTEHLCNNACMIGYYGKNCSMVCSHNCKTCRNTDGLCFCKAGWMGSNCTTECSQSYGENCQYPCNHCINKTCDKLNGSCSYGCIYGEQCNQDIIPNNLTDSITVIIGGTVGACAALMIAVVFVIFVHRLKKKATPLTNRESIAVDELSRFPMESVKQEFHLSETTYALPERTNRGPPTNKYISVRNIKAQITNMSVNKNAGFKREYQDIPRGELHESLEAKKTDNKVKNRYTTIYPYDHSRIVLKTFTASEGDYINANYIETRTDRHVTMFHYTTWSDHGVADPLSLVVFHRHVIRDTAGGKYTVVHCSAGVGRTGTYIALDALYREGEKTGKINVPMYIRTMRKDRMNMIQGDEQYKLLYLALMEAFSGPSRCVTTEKFVGTYQEQTCYINCGDMVQKSSQTSEFEELRSLRKKNGQQDYTSGRAQILANYTQSVLPVEEFLCHLSYIKGHNTYYNAVLFQSYLEKDSLISAQYPLPDNTEDFLRLIKDFDARVVVFLCPLKDIESTPSWFPTDNQSKLNGLFFIKNISTTKVPNITKTKLNIQPQGFSEMNITVIECPAWREGKETADKRVLLDVIKAVKTEKSDQEGRIIVLSSDGATRCGPFCVVYNVLEQISVDREVDIFTTTRQLQVRRPEFVSTLEEYQLCHDTVAEYLLNDCVYGNC